MNVRQMAASSALVLFCATMAIAQEPVCGDVNGSGTVNTSDALSVLKKGVGQDVTLSCSAYDTVISHCEDLLGMCRGDSCGDGAVNAVGEQCDGEDLDGYDCAAFGYLKGELGCKGSCDFDVSHCIHCGSFGGRTVGGFCWFLGLNDQSCDDVCTDVELVYDKATSTYAGSAALNSKGCTFVAEVLVPDVPPAVTLNEICGNGFNGCTVDTASDRYARCISPATTSTGKNPNQRRICACK